MFIPDCTAGEIGRREGELSRVIAANRWPMLPTESTNQEHAAADDGMREFVEKWLSGNTTKTKVRIAE